MDPIPSSKDVVAVAGKEPLRFVIDLNRDGVDDLKQLGKGQPFVEAALKLVMMFTGSHTLFHKWAEAYFTQVKPQLDAVLAGRP